MQDDSSLGDLWLALYANGTVTGLALLALIVVAIMLAAQIEQLYSSCSQLIAHRHQLIAAQRAIEAEVAATRANLQELTDALPALRNMVLDLDNLYQKLNIEATEARRLHVREVVVTDIFIQSGDRPFLATISRPKADPDEPLAELWRAGREHMVYAVDIRTAATRFGQRFPASHGFVVGPAGPFEIPWNPPEELPVLEAAMDRS
jgi:hypothetical protein